MYMYVCMYDIRIRVYILGENSTEKNMRCCEILQNKIIKKRNELGFTPIHLCMRWGERAYADFLHENICSIYQCVCVCNCDKLTNFNLDNVSQLRILDSYARRRRNSHSGRGCAVRVLSDVSVAKWSTPALYVKRKLHILLKRDIFAWATFCAHHHTQN